MIEKIGIVRSFVLPFFFATDIDSYHKNVSGIIISRFGVCNLRSHAAPRGTESKKKKNINRLLLQLVM